MLSVGMLSVAMHLVGAAVHPVVAAEMEHPVVDRVAEVSVIHLPHDSVVSFEAVCPRL